MDDSKPFPFLCILHVALFSVVALCIRATECAYARYRLGGIPSVQVNLGCYFISRSFFTRICYCARIHFFLLCLYVFNRHFLKVILPSIGIPKSCAKSPCTFWVEVTHWFCALQSPGTPCSSPWYSMLITMYYKTHHLVISVLTHPRNSVLTPWRPRDEVIFSYKLRRITVLRLLVTIELVYIYIYIINSLLRPHTPPRMLATPLLPYPTLRYPHSTPPSAPYPEPSLPHPDTLHTATHFHPPPSPVCYPTTYHLPTPILS